MPLKLWGEEKANPLAMPLSRLQGLRNDLEHVQSFNELQNTVRGCSFVITVNVTASHTVLDGATC